MEIKLEKMTAVEYDEFYKWSFNNHVRDLVKCTKVSVEQAINETERELQDMLPNGIDTENNILMAIVDASNQRVGLYGIYMRKLMVSINAFM